MMIKFFYKIKLQTELELESESGFSLIEVAIVLLVVGLLAIPLIQIYNLERKDREISITEGSLDYVRDALTKYAVENGRYPLPADRDISVELLGSGIEHVGAFPNCGTAPAVGKACRTTGLPATQIFIGDVPFRDLGINVEHIVDGYSGKLTYAVTPILTNAGTFVDDGGIIQVTRRDNLDHGTTFSNVHFAVIGHGPDNSGAFSLSGTPMGPCLTGGAANRDTINCDHADRTFTINSEFFPSGSWERSQYLGGGATYYDDSLEYITSTQGHIWSYAVGVPDMQNRNPGNALIGTIPCGISTTECVPSGGNAPGSRVDLAVAKLEVMGEVNTDIISVDRLCPTHADGRFVNPLTTCPLPLASAPLTPVDPYPENVFDPAVIAKGTYDPLNYGDLGGGIRCLSSGLKGIKNSDEECVSIFPPAFVPPVACASGTFPKGVKADGTFDCITPPPP